MSIRKNKGSNVVYRHEEAGRTHVWHKNSTGNTTKSGHRITNHKTGRVSDHNGKTVYKGR